jgi:hypothetical protein
MESTTAKGLSEKSSTTKKVGYKFTLNDLNISKILAAITLVRLQSFINRIQISEKQKLKAIIINFVNRYTTKIALKAILTMIEEELPTLLGYEHCTVFLNDEQRKMLYSIVLANDEASYKGHYKLEQEFTIAPG